MVFSQLDFDGLGVGADWPLGVQGGVCVAKPGLQLRQGMLELTQSQQGSLQLVLWWNKDKHSGFKIATQNWAVMKCSWQIHAKLQDTNKD